MIETKQVKQRSETFDLYFIELPKTNIVFERSFFLSFFYKNDLTVYL